MAKFSIRTSDIESREHLIELAQTMAAITAELEPLLKSHSARVASNCANFCEEFKLLPESDIFDLYVAGLMHDFGQNDNL